ncbi:DUF3307 domain-containing protein [Streptomyces fimicarius]|uniref:DUF3307 domain-containing protein n=1 Tax=Streptomyces griseus TaxID=1911 RepID=UPI00369B4794
MSRPTGRTRPARPDTSLTTCHQLRPAGLFRPGAATGTHAAVTALALAVAVTVLDLSIGALPALLALTWIAATHAVIDRRWPVARWMRFARQEQWAQHGGAAHVDQTAHVLVLVVAALALTR